MIMIMARDTPWFIGEDPILRRGESVVRRFVLLVWIRISSCSLNSAGIPGLTRGSARMVLTKARGIYSQKLKMNLSNF